MNPTLTATLPTTAERPIRVMLVDDHASFRASARWLLETEGFEVVAEAASGECALDLVVDAAPELVLLDVGLPGIDLSGGDGNPGALPARPGRAPLQPRALRSRVGSRARLRRRRLRAQGGSVACRDRRDRSVDLR